MMMYDDDDDMMIEKNARTQFCLVYEMLIINDIKRSLNVQWVQSLLAVWF